MTRDDIYYRAMTARDYRFDGKFFVGVKTTGIYCRPICPAKPKRENVEFFATAALAERAGYRPCLRCRPECAPSSPAWSGKSAVVQRALRLIADRGADELSEEAFAARLGVSARHLRRLFEEELGRTPKQIADDTRLNFARRLVVESTLPLADVAFAAGFGSLRRFNDAFVKRFKRAPSAMRRRRAEPAGDGLVELSLSFRPPFDWESTLAFHRRHAIAGIEAFGDGTYERIFAFEKSVCLCRVSRPSAELPVVRVAVLADSPRALLPATQRVRRMFDLDCDPLLIANHFGDDEPAASLLARHPGVRLPRGWDPFEMAVATVLGQLVSVPQSCRLVEQLVTAYGARAKHPIVGTEVRLFPQPRVLAGADLSAVRTTAARRRSIRALAALVADGKLELTETQDPAAVKQALRAIPGIGPWSAEYIALRALGDTDAFPGTDLLLKRAVALHPGLDLEKFRPWRSYLALTLWKEHA